MLPVIFILGMAFTGMITIFMIIYMEKQIPQHMRERRLGMSKNSMLKQLKKFQKYDNFFLTRPGLRKVHARIREISVYTDEEARVKAVQFYSSTIKALWGITIIGGIYYRDLFTTLVIFAFAYVYKTTVVDAKLDKEHLKLLTQLLDTLSNIRQAYLREQDITEAISQAEIKPYLQRSMSALHQILVGSESSRRLEEFIRTSPYRTVQTFAVVTYLIYTSGDTIVDGGGDSAFTKAVDMMEDEVRLEIRRIRTMRVKFSVVKYLGISPVLGLRAIEIFFSGTIPGTSAIYHGPIGYLIKTAIIVMGIISYMLITKMTTKSTVQEDDRLGMAYEMLQSKSYHKFIKGIIPKKMLRKQKLTDRLNKASSSMNFEIYYSKKVLASVMCFILSLGVFYFATFIGKNYIYNNVKEAALISSGEKLNSQEILERQKIDAEYLSLPKILSKAETKRFVDSRFPKLKHLEKDVQVQRLMIKYEQYYSIHFKYGYIIAAYVFGIIGWLSPAGLLLYRGWVIKTEALEDVLQLQTLLAILMETNIDTLDTLYWMEKTTRVHKRLITECYHEYPSEPNLALNKLKVKVATPEFRRIVDRLKLTIYQLTLKEAFGELSAERDDMLKMREMVQDQAINNKRVIASRLSMVTIYATAILYVVVPLGILSAREFTTAFSNF